MLASKFVTEFNQCLKPLAPAILILGNLFGCIVVIVLLQVLSMTRLHVNCKFVRFPHFSSGTDKICLKYQISPQFLVDLLHNDVHASYCHVCA